jgi:transposase-like protein
MATKKRRGRKADPSSKSGKIRELLSTGMTAAEIAKRVGCTVALVYNIKSKAQGGDNKAQSGDKPAKGKPGRKPAAAASSGIAGGDLEAILTAVKNAEKERIQMRAALEKIAGIIQDALS